MNMEIDLKGNNTNTINQGFDDALNGLACAYFNYTNLFIANYKHYKTSNNLRCAI